MTLKQMMQSNSMFRVISLLLAIVILAMAVPALGATAINPQSPLAPVLDEYQRELAGKRVILPNVAFLFPTQNDTGNAWQLYIQAVQSFDLAREKTPDWDNLDVRKRLRITEVRQALNFFYDATRTQKFDLAALTTGVSSYVDVEEKLNNIIATIDEIAKLTEEVGQQLLVNERYDNATDNAQTLLCLSNHWLSMPINVNMIKAGLEYETKSLEMFSEIYKMTARPQMEQRATASLNALNAQREIWRRKGEILMKFSMAEYPELLIIINDYMINDADPAFRLCVLDYLNELMRQTMNLPGEKAFNIFLDYDSRKNLRLLFIAEKDIIRQISAKFTENTVVGIAFQARQMHELIARIN